MKTKIPVAASVIMIAALLVGCMPATTQQSAATATSAAAVATQAPAVVNVTTVEVQNAMEQIYQTVNPSVVDIRVVENASATTQDSQYYFPGFPQFSSPNQQNSAPSQVEGAGFIFDSAGHIVTNNHVVTDASRIVVTFSDGTQADAKLIGTDPATDLAVIQVSGVDASLIKPVTLGSSAALKVGQMVLAIGSPFQLQGTMTSGIVSALGRTMESTSSSSNNNNNSNNNNGYSTTTTAQAYYSIPDIIQTDAAINHGNSGGPLLDLSGQVIGVNTAIESTSDSNAGIGYAIPSDIVKLVADDLIANGSSVHTYLGISTQQMSADVAKAMNLPANTHGIQVVSVSSSSPAGKAGLKGANSSVSIDGIDTPVGGDILVSIDGTPVNNYNDLVSYLLLKTTVGQKVTLGVIRDGKEISVTATLEARPANS